MINYVHLEIKRIQSYLFSVPKLKAMVGANVILGETTMGTKDDLEKDNHPEKLENMVQLAVANGGLSPVSSISEETKKLFSDSDLEDDSPIEFAEKGIVSRHGGHFSAFFTSKEKAEEFESAARMMIAEKLPGAMVKCDIFDEKQMKEKLVERKRSDEEKQGESKGPKYKNDNPAFVQALAEIPQFALCEGSGNEPASEKKMSASYISKEEKAGEFYSGKTNDIVGMLYKKDSKIPKGHEYKYSFEDIADNKYLAVIHADGNNMGKLSSDWARENLKKHNNIEDGKVLNIFIENELKREAFFYSMRKATRRAIRSSIKAIFHTVPERYRLFMAGGDDLLLVCEAKYAMPFIKSYAEEIKQNKLISGEDLSIGAGIVIAHHNVPIYQLHALAEELASNAKKRNKHLEKDDSVVDWIVSSESYIGNLDEYRKRNIKHEAKLTKETVYMTMKPYKILGENELSLESLMSASKNLKNDKDSKRASRNKYKKLLDDLKKGSVGGRLLYKEMKESLQDKNKKDAFMDIKKILGIPEKDESWPYIKFGNEEELFTCVPDIIQLAEIDLLGKADSKKNVKKEGKNNE